MASTDQPVLRTRSGLEMPALGFGTWGLEGKQCQKMVEQAIRVGYRHVDTAQRYGNEDNVGHAVRASGLDRDELFLTTKIQREHEAPADLHRTLRTSLASLGVDRVDLLMLHWPPAAATAHATLEALAKAKADGLATHLGGSNFDIEHLEMAAAIAPVDVLQIEVHPYFQQNELRSWAAANDVAVVAHCPIARGAVLGDPVIESIATAHRSTVVQVTLAWLLAHGLSALPRSSKKRRVKSNFAATAVTLTPEQVAQIDALDRNQRVMNPKDSHWD